MSHTTTERPDLDRLGDALTAGADRDLRRRRHPVRRVAVALAILIIVGTGTAAAAGVFSPHQVAAGMPAGAVIFDQTAGAWPAMPGRYQRARTDADTSPTTARMPLSRLANRETTRRSASLDSKIIVSLPNPVMY